MTTFVTDRPRAAVVLTPELQGYTATVNQLRTSPYLDYPMHVHLETFAQCNASCTFCPYTTLDRKGERMPDALIEKVINELTEIPRNLPFQLSPFKVNEPFLDTRLFDVLDTIHAKLPNATVALTSNSHPITAKKLAQLATYSHIQYLWISFNEHTAGEYQEVMKIDFAKTIERLRMLHAYRASGGTIRIVVSRVGDGSIRDREYVEYVKREFPLFEAAVFPRGSWLGSVDNIQAPIHDIPCQRWFELSITATGVVAHCCMDGKAEYAIGNVATEHVLEIYNKPEFRRLREDTASRLDVSPCNTCAFR